jgi:hypothetical protein
MGSTFKVLFFLKRDKHKANGTIPLFCRITVDGKEARFGMKKDVNPQLWDVKAGKAAGRTAEATEINTLLDKTKAAIYAVYRDLQERENNVNAEKIKNVFLGIDIKHEYLLVVFDEHNKEKKELSDKGAVSPSTCDKYRITRDHLAEFMKLKRNISDIALKEIDYGFITDFEHFLRTTRNCAKNTTAKYMQFFKHIILIALKKEWIYKNPFADYAITIVQPDRGYLTQQEVEILMQQQFDKKHLERVRDIFVFSCFCGLSYIDVRNLTEEKISRLFDNNLWITGKRGKTDVPYEIPLLDIPKLILDKYKDKQKNNCSLPVVSNNSVNKYLKIIAGICGINKRLTYHWTRHNKKRYRLLINQLRDIHFLIGNDLETSLVLRYA